MKRFHLTLLFLLFLPIWLTYFLSQRRVFCYRIWLGCDQERTGSNRLAILYNLSPNVRLVDLNRISNLTMKCVKTKAILANITTNICVYGGRKDLYVSAAFRDRHSIWEKSQVTRIIAFLLRYPDLHLIDVGANIGTYTMFAVSVERFVLAIDCFEPNLLLLRRAIQLSQATDRVVLVQNAIYARSGVSLQLSADVQNIGGQGLTIAVNKTFPKRKSSLKNNLHTVRSIAFDDVLPILWSHNTRRAVMKIDIEGSENFVFETGRNIFSQIDIPLIQMEWIHIAQNPDRAGFIIDFLHQRSYQPMSESCRLLDKNDYQSWPIDIYWLKTNITTFC